MQLNDRSVIHIGLLGAGTVASGVCRLLEMNADDIQKKVGACPNLKKIYTRTTEKAKQLGFSNENIANDFEDLIQDPDIQIIIELIGGIDIAKDYIERTLKAGKNVVTANKDLIARHGVELYRLADQYGVDLMYEASVGGGIPIIMPMRRTLAGNSIQSMMGILNGTTNYMLTQMTKNGNTYEEALADAQALGYAEANPSADVDGLDAGRKIAILARLAFNTNVTDEMVPCEGISKLRKRDFEIANQLNYVIKMLAVAKCHDAGIELGVYPAFVSKKHPLATVSDAYNALFISGDAVGDVMLYGQGAGAMPTASSVVGDVMQVMRHLNTDSTGQGNDLTLLDRDVLNEACAKHSFFMVMTIKDKPNVLATVAKLFGQHNVSIKSVTQNPIESEQSELILITHEVEQGAILQTIDVLNRHEDIVKVESMIRVMVS